MTKEINALAQTGALEDLIWAIMNDAETEAHYDRMKIAIKRDIETSKNIDLTDELLNELEQISQAKEQVKKARYGKTLVAIQVAEKVATHQHNEKFSCVFKHQLLSMAETRDSFAVIDDDELNDYIEDLYDLTTKNVAFVISKFLGLEVESCMACLFENNLIERSKTNEN